MSAAPSRNEVTRQPVGGGELVVGMAQAKAAYINDPQARRLWQPMLGGQARRRRGEDVNSKIARGSKRPQTPARSPAEPLCQGLAEGWPTRLGRGIGRAHFSP